MHWIGCSIIVSLIGTKRVRFAALELYRPNLGELLAVEAPDESSILPVRRGAISYVVKSAENEAVMTGRWVTPPASK
jgi:hypothetical protein